MESNGSLNDAAKTSSVGTSAVILALGTALSRVLGLIRDMLTARYFPADVRDAFFVAFRLPNLFRRIFGEGALSVSFVPIFIDILSGSGSGSGVKADEVDRRAREFVAGVFALLLAVTIVISLIAIIFMDELLGWLLFGEAYRSIPGKFETTVHLGRIMFGFLVLVSLYAYFMAILTSLKKFAAAALAPCLFNISLIVAAFVSPRLANGETVLAWAVIVGGFLQMAVLIPQVVRSRYFPVPTLKALENMLVSHDIGRMVKAVLPSILSVGVIQLTALVNVSFASRLPQGSHSYIYLADRILELPLTLFVVSISSALLPALARQWALGDKHAMGHTINHYIRLIAFVTLPAAVGMFVLAHPITEVLFLGREFKYVDAIATAQVIQVYSISLMLVAGVRILAQGFYAIRNAWYPALAAVVSLLSHVLFAWTLTRSFGLVGLACASVGSAFVNLMMLALAYNSWVGSLEMKKLWKSLAKFVVCAAVMVLVLMLYQKILDAVGGRLIKKTAVLLFIIAAGAVVYLAMAHLLKLPEYRETVMAMSAKLRAKFKPTGDGPTPR